ncbi:MAG: aminotransferase class I/II-fold pyridoxal phosphate-dependent enzyme [Paracoccaceae bacterium]
MEFPERFSNLPEYAFPRLRLLLDQYPAGKHVLNMSVGDPKHHFPKWVKEVLEKNIHEFRQYPPNDGSPELLKAISRWIKRRYGVLVDNTTEIMALNGTREGLFAALQALCPENKFGDRSIVLMPNPFYQVYAVASLAANVSPIYLTAMKSNKFLPDFSSVPEELLTKTAVIYICSPSNPQGSVASESYWQNLLILAEKFNFRVFADECYSEIYREEPPVGILEVANKIGTNPENVVSFHSLSKRSNMAGLRSGFVASGKNNISAIKKLRAYAGAPLPLPLQRVAEKLWDDEDHVEISRNLYKEKFILADTIFSDVESYSSPEAGFFLWLEVENDEKAAKKLWIEAGIKVLPGSYLSRDTKSGNPGKKYIRVALVEPIEEVAHGLKMIRKIIYN